MGKRRMSGPGSPPRTHRIAGAVAAALLAAACGSTVPNADRLAAGGGSTENELSLGTSAPGSPSATDGTGTGGPATGDGAPPSTSVKGPTATDPAVTGPAVTGPAGAAAPAVPARGRGWDEQFIYVGVTTNQDISTVGGTLGVKSLDSGDQRADAEAMIADINERGGIFGRQVKGVFLDIKTTDDGEASAQATCTAFTQDHAVVAVVGGAAVNDTPSFRACMSKARVPVLALNVLPFDDEEYAEFGGYYVGLPIPTWTRFAPALANRLLAQDFFAGWDTTTGGRGTGAVKVGLLSTDTTLARRVTALLDRELARVGHAPTETFYYADTATLQGAVLRFRSEGITHVLSTDAVLFLFATQAETQQYRPRYGLSSTNVPGLLLQGTVPVEQLSGAMGVGTVPGLDVDAHNDPGTPGAAECRATATRHGVEYRDDARYAIAYFYGFCDAFRLLQAAMEASGLDGEQIRTGLGTTGVTFRPAVTFSSGLSNRSSSLPGSGRDLFWDAACSCFRYRGPAHAL